MFVNKFYYISKSSHFFTGIRMEEQMSNHVYTLQSQLVPAADPFNFTQAGKQLRWWIKNKLLKYILALNGWV
jgi:hypothetical protein